MRWVGEGSELWRVRVDLFVARARPAKPQINEIVKSLKSALTGNDGDATTSVGAVAADQGTGAANRPVIGVLFWVRADDVGQAALTAVDVARRASASAGAGPDLYDVTVIPRSAVSFANEAKYPSMPD